MLALPLRCGQVPAVAENSQPVLPPAAACGPKAYSVTFAGLLFTGRPTAQTIALPVPFEETLVKNPGSCTDTGSSWDLLSLTRVTEGEVCSRQMMIWLAP